MVSKIISIENSVDMRYEKVQITSFKYMYVRLTGFVCLFKTLSLTR